MGEAILRFKSRDGPPARASVPLAFLSAVAISSGLMTLPIYGQLTADESICVQSCHDSCYGRYIGCYELCMKEYCEGKQKPAPYGAIAFGTHGAEAISYGKATQDEADKVALTTCNKYGANCKVVFRYQYTCAALAVANGMEHCEAATGYSAKDAEANAMAECQRDWGKCVTNLSACSSAGVGKAYPPAPPKAASWGAIAYSSSDMAAGSASGKSDRGAAEKEAMNACSQRGKNCVLETTFNKQCGALAADRGISGWGVATNQKEAQRRAIEECTKAGGTQCGLHVSVCSF